MSVQAIAWALSVKTGGPRNKSVLLCIANYADEDGICWPSQARIADETEQSVDTVQRALLELEEKGLLMRGSRPIKRGRWPVTQYALSLPRTTSSQNGDKAEPQIAARKTTEPHPAARQGTRDRAATVRHEPSLEPSLIDDDGAKPKSMTREMEDKLRTAVGEDVLDAASPSLMVMAEPNYWLSTGADMDLDILPTLRAVGERVRQKPRAFNRKISIWNYFTRAVIEAYKQRTEKRPELEDAPYHGGNNGNRGARRTTGDAARDLDAKIKGGATLPARPAF